jgi:hypothetical protein
MAKIVLQNGQVKEAFRASLIDFYNGEVSLQDLKQRELSYAKEESYFQAAGVRSVIQWLNGETETTKEELTELLKEPFVVYVLNPLDFKELDNYLDPKDNEV